MNEQDRILHELHNNFVLKCKRLLFKGVEGLGDLDQVRLDDEPEYRNRAIVSISDTMVTAVVAEMADAIHKLRMFGDDVSNELRSLRRISCMLKVLRKALDRPAE